MSFTFIISWLKAQKQRFLPEKATKPPKNGLKTASNGPKFHLAEEELPDFVRASSVAMRYYRWLRQIDWARFPERDLSRFYPVAPVPYRVFAAACLVKIDQNFNYMPQLHRFLSENTALIWLLGFSHGVSVASCTPEDLPTHRHFTQMLRQIPNEHLQFLLDESVRLLRAELGEQVPDFGQAISLDTKHILAWVQENNLNTFVPERHNPKKQPRGDADCKLGYKANRNRPPVDTSADPATPRSNPRPASKTDVGSFYWGYGSGVIATKVAGWGEFVLAEMTQPFNRADVSYFYPLMAKTEQRLGFRPTFGAFDAAFDAFYVYEYFHRPGTSWQESFAAVPYTDRVSHGKTFSDEGLPLCEAGITMRLKYTYLHQTSFVPHERAHYICPLIGGDRTCPIAHRRWPKGGCTHRIPTSVGARLRHQIDRTSDIYQHIYKQRTATERINSLAKELGIERPHLRNQQSIANLNTLIYVVLNLRALRRIQQQKQP